MPTKKQQNWHKVYPHTISAREHLLHHCHSRCFLSPSDLKYPVCNRLCHLDPRALLAAQQRARLNYHHQIEQKAKRLRKKLDYK